MGQKPPGDETIRGIPHFGRKGTDPEVELPGKKDKYSKPIDDGRATGDHVGGTQSGRYKLPTAEAAPEVSQGAWRERAFLPRATMGREEMIEALRAPLAALKSKVGSAAPVFELLRSEWLPVLRQAVEQAGGDGIDAWLLTVLKPPGKFATAPLLAELIAAFEKMREAAAVDDLLIEAKAVLEAVMRATEQPRRISFKQMERELEGKVEIHELLSILLSDDAELKARLHEIDATMDTIREQLKSMPGTKPDGMYANFVRLKAEARVLAAELQRRHPPQK